MELLMKPAKVSELTKKVLQEASKIAKEHSESEEDTIFIANAFLNASKILDQGICKKNPFHNFFISGSRLHCQTIMLIDETVLRNLRLVRDHIWMSKKRSILNEESLRRF